MVGIHEEERGFLRPLTAGRMTRTRASLFSAAAFLTIGIVCAQDAPLVKEGLWSIHTVTIDEPGAKKVEGTRSICRSHAYDESVRARAKAQAAKCKTNVENRSGSKIETETDCVVAGSEIHSKGTATLSGDTASHSETHITYTPAMYGVTASTMIQDQKYVGACPAGMAPGDFMAADGTIQKRGR